MRPPVLLLTPPFTQLNTPYPATAYLKGFLATRGIPAEQADLGLDVTLALFSRAGLEQVFAAGAAKEDLTPNACRMLALRPHYTGSIDAVIRFLQGGDPTLARSIAGRGFLPEAGRFAQTADLEAAFGTMGLQDKAKHLATLYLEDLADFIQEAVDPRFGFSRYAESLGRSAHAFDGLEEALQQPLSLVEELTVSLLEQKIQETGPALVALSVPFPGNLLGALRCGQWLKAHHPHIAVAMGGGFPNTELRSLSDPRPFRYIDFVTLDDGEAPMEALYRHVTGEILREALKRTFALTDGAVTFIDNKACTDYRQGQVGTPDYTGLQLDRYISVLEVTNPMHSLWSDGRWNKLTMAHGCYWGKCTFCDVSLPYIAQYEPLTAGMLCDRVEELMAKTGSTGFHFVDEAAPPALMRAFALEVLRRGLVLSWWANVRFEKAFTPDLCRLLRASGCIAVSGGLEVASDRLLALIDKGITVAQVARVNHAFTEAGILVHAYLMYGFPTQTAQETVDSMEMVRQLFAAGVLQSAFWHRFALTAHSPVGLEPARFGVTRDETVGAFANNDVEYTEATGTDHDAFGWGLEKSLFNYMHGIGLTDGLHKWFDFKIPRTTVPADWALAALASDDGALPKPTAKVVWLGGAPRLELTTKSKKGSTWSIAVLQMENKTETVELRTDPERGAWLAALLPELAPGAPQLLTRADVMARYAAAGFEDFELFWDNKPVTNLRRAGLLHL